MRVMMRCIHDSMRLTQIPARAKMYQRIDFSQGKEHTARRKGGDGVEEETEGVMSMLMRLTRLQFQYMRAHLEKLELYPGQPQLLLALRDHANASQKELARVMEATPATLTVMLRRMDAKHLVSRVSDPQDMRVTRLSLTDEGYEKVRQIDAFIRQTNDMLDGLFTPEELRTVSGMIRRVCAQLGVIRQESNGDTRA